MRTTTNTVTFRSPFILPGWDTPWPPGDYVITTDEEPLETSFSAFRRVSTTIQLRSGAETRHVTIAPEDLMAAIVRDGPSTDPSGT
jgi:hypothetical protein